MASPSTTMANENASNRNSRGYSAIRNTCKGSSHGWNDIWLDPAFRAWNIEEYLAAIDCPTLVIQGEDDEFGTIAQVAAIRDQATGRVETRVLDACGHSPHRDQPNQTLDAIAGFLKNL